MYSIYALLQLAIKHTHTYEWWKKNLEHVHRKRHWPTMNQQTMNHSPHGGRL